MPMIFERSPDTNTIISLLRGCNDEISYYELARQSGLPIQRVKSVLPSARRALRIESGVLFGVVRGEGLRRLTDADKVRKPEYFMKKVFRGAGRELKDLSTISDFCRLSKNDQQSVTTHRTVLNVMRQQASMKTVEIEPEKITSNPSPNITALLKTRGAV